MMNFTESILEKIKNSSPIIAGIDPNFDLMPDFLKPKNNSPEEIQAKLSEFSTLIIKAVHDKTAAVKIQSAYFEKYGLAGMAALANSIKIAKAHDLLVILDVKRGDIGATSQAYAMGVLSDEVPLPNGQSYQSDFASDAMTLNPFMGEDSMRPFIDLAAQNGKGLFLLVKTSNPGSNMIMTQEGADPTISTQLAKQIESWGAPHIGASGFHHIGAVIGATLAEDARKFRQLMPHTLFLVPGMGAQGGDVNVVKALMTSEGTGVIVPVSRGLTYFKEIILNESVYVGSVKGRLETYTSLLK